MNVHPLLALLPASMSCVVAMIFGFQAIIYPTLWETVSFALLAMSAMQQQLLSVRLVLLVFLANPIAHIVLRVRSFFTMMLVHSIHQRLDTSLSSGIVHSF